jgi:protein subunit release factor B
VKQKLLSLSKEKGDFKIETFRSGGKGGQHQNTTDSGVRIIHVKTGISAESRTERSQKQNMQIAFRNLCKKPEFQNWLRIESARTAGFLKTQKEIIQEIENETQDKYLKVEVNVAGKWVKE